MPTTKVVDPETCGNCQYWRKHGKAWGECTDPESKVVVDEAIARAVVKIRLVPDMATCSNWYGV